MKRKVLAWLLAMCMVLTMIPMISFADSTETPALPTATVTEIENENLTFAMNFKANEASDDQLAYYGDWYADFELTVNKDVTFNANGGEDGFLSGRYEAWNSGNWVNVPFENAILKANEPLKVMAYAAEMMGQKGLKLTYADVANDVKSFDCGVFFEDSFMQANPDLKVTLELKMYNPADETESYVIGETYTFPKVPELPTATAKDIENENLTFAMNFKADKPTEKQLSYYGDWYADFELTVNKDVTFNANGGADGFLSGQYDEWNKNWINVPFENVTLNANEPLKVMEYAAEQLGEPGLKYTYRAVYEEVRDFDCGVFFEEAFLQSNPDLEVTLELRMYNPVNEDESYVIGKTYKFPKKAPKLPTATVTDIENEELTFALNFKADEASPEQLAYYGDWHADFELTVNKDVTFNANDGADGFLSGQYDEWGNGWVKVPPTDVTLKANEPLKIMDYAAKLLGQSGLQLTYNDVYTSVNDFDCGVFFEEAFMQANPDLKVTLELKMYNPADETESYVIGETYTFPKVPELPTATVKGIDVDNLTFAMNFKADEVTPEQLAYYGKWYTDFELSMNKDVTFNANGGADGYLSGSYDAWNNGNWVNVPFEDVKLKAHKTLKIMEYAAEQLGEPGLKYTFEEIYDAVKDFDCGALFTREFIEENPDLEVRLKLKMYNPDDESENYLIGETYVFTLADIVAMNTNTGKVYSDVTDALDDAKVDETVIMLKDYTERNVTVEDGIKFDLNGYSLTTNYCSSFGNTVDYSEDNSGVIVVPADRIFMQRGNEQLPIYNGEGYQFFEVIKFNEAVLKIPDQPDAKKYAFQPMLEPAAHALLDDESKVAASGVNVKVELAWETDDTDGTRTQEFVYKDDFVNKFVNTFVASTGKYSKMFTLTVANAANYRNLSYDAIIASDRGVEFSTK